MQSCSDDQNIAIWRDSSPGRTRLAGPVRHAQCQQCVKPKPEIAPLRADKRYPRMITSEDVLTLPWRNPASPDIAESGAHFLLACAGRGGLGYRGRRERDLRWTLPGLVLVAALTAIAMGGCALPAPEPGCYGPILPEHAPQLPYQNPVFVPAADPLYVWETVVDVIDDYFRIEREEPLRVMGSTITEGRLETFPEVSPTVFEPWRQDVAGRYELMENTLQSMRRRASVRVAPTSGGYLVEVAVTKELEDLRRPERATAGAATFRYDSTLSRVVNPADESEQSQGWISQGRDTALEQKILGHIQSRFGYRGAGAVRQAATAAGR